MNILWGLDLRDWVKEKLPVSNLNFQNGVSLGIGDDEKLLAAIVYTDYTGYSMQLSIAAESPRWCSRTALKAIFHYPFNDCNCVRVTACVAKKNTRSRRLVQGLGFKQEGVVRRGFAVDDLIVYGMLKDECRWIGG